VPGGIKEPSVAILGCFAIIYPVIAVAALSLAAAFDLEAKKHTSEERVAFLERQTGLLESAATAREFAKLLIETESRLLGETVNWHARRSFAGVKRAGRHVPSRRHATLPHLHLHSQS